MEDEHSYFKINSLMMNFLESFFQLSMNNILCVQVASHIGEWPWRWVHRENSQDTDFQEEVEGVFKTHDIDNDENFDIYSNQKHIFCDPQSVTLQFECEFQINIWELVAVDNNDDEFTFVCGTVVYFYPHCRPGQC